jgi:hypothetical protein
MLKVQLATDAIFAGGGVGPSLNLLHRVVHGRGQPFELLGFLPLRGERAV